MLIEAALLLQPKPDQKIVKESICDANKRFVEAENKEDKQIRELFEKLFETMERDSWKRWDSPLSN